MVEHSHAAELDRIFSALADPTRRAILQRLTNHPATINEIAEPFPVSLNAVSKHVMVLERAGLVRREIRGREHYCWIEPHPLREADVWLKKYEQFWEPRLDALEAYVARKYKASKQFKAAKRRTHGSDR
jgi:DNA-binding transcriptional ArsR family regulator